jgi:hypothetical protein
VLIISLVDQPRDLIGNLPVEAAAFDGLNQQDVLGF